MKAEERKRKAEETTEREERAKLRKEWDKNYEVKTNLLFYKKKKETNYLLVVFVFQESRETRVNSWKTFQTVGKAKDSNKSKPPTLFKPPKYKPEAR